MYVFTYMAVLVRTPQRVQLLYSVIWLEPLLHHSAAHHAVSDVVWDHASAHRPAAPRTRVGDEVPSVGGGAGRRSFVRRDMRSTGDFVLIIAWLDRKRFCCKHSPDNAYIGRVGG
jgi:hypothetical protein